MSNENGHRNSFEERRKIKFASYQSTAHMRFYNHIESQDFLEIVLRDWLDEAGPQKSTHRRNVGRKVVLTGARRVLQKARAHKCAKRPLAKDNGGRYEIDRRYVIGPFIAIGILIDLGRCI